MNSTECMVCLNKNYTNKRTKFKISASLQRDTQQVKNLSLHSILTLCCDAVCTLASKHVLKWFFVVSIISESIKYGDQCTSNKIVTAPML